MVYKSACCNGFENAYLGALVYEKRSTNQNKKSFVTMLRHLIQWCIDDSRIKDFVFNSPPPSLRFARFSDCFKFYVEDVIEEYKNRLEDENCLESLK